MPAGMSNKPEHIMPIMRYLIVRGRICGKPSIDSSTCNTAMITKNIPWRYDSDARVVTSELFTCSVTNFEIRVDSSWRDMFRMRSAQKVFMLIEQ